VKRPHLFHVLQEPATFAPLIAASEAAGFRIGWLDLDRSAEVPIGVEQALSHGVPRAVIVTDAGSVAVKRRGGDWVMDDLLREHFLGFRAVLLRGFRDGAQAIPGCRLLEPVAQDLWRLEPVAESDTDRKEIDAAGFVRQLRKPLC